MTDRDIIKRAAEILKSRGCHAHGEFIERILSELPKPSPEDGKIIEFAVAIGENDCGAVEFVSDYIGDTTESRRHALDVVCEAVDGPTHAGIVTAVIPAIPRIEVRVVEGRTNA